MRRTRLIGLTGAIGSGKTTVSALLRERGALIVCADEIARRQAQPGGAGYRAILSAFGSEYVKPDGSLDRAKLGRLVFADEKARKLLDSVTHPLVIKEVLDTVENALRSENPPDVLVLDVPLLIETGLDGAVDEVWVVVSPEKDRMARIMSRDGITADDAQNRIRSQAGDEFRLQYADVVIENTGTLAELESRVLKALNQRN